MLFLPSHLKYLLPASAWVSTFLCISCQSRNFLHKIWHPFIYYFFGPEKKKITRRPKRYSDTSAARSLCLFQQILKNQGTPFLRLLGQQNLCADKEIRFLIFLLVTFSGTVCNKQEFATGIFSRIILRDDYFASYFCFLEELGTNCKPQMKKKLKYFSCFQRKSP